MDATRPCVLGRRIHLRFVPALLGWIQRYHRRIAAAPVLDRDRECVCQLLLNWLAVADPKSGALAHLTVEVYYTGGNHQTERYIVMGVVRQT